MTGQEVDRDALWALVEAIIDDPAGRDVEVEFDAILALVRPVAGVTLTGDDRVEALEALKPVLSRLESEAHWRAPAVRRLVERLEAAS